MAPHRARPVRRRAAGAGPWRAHRACSSWPASASPCGGCDGSASTTPAARAEFRRTGRLAAARGVTGAGHVLTVVRHGRTDANRSGLLLGRLDVDARPARRGPGRRASPPSVGPVDRVVTSPLAARPGRPRPRSGAAGRGRRALDRARLRRPRRHARCATCPPSTWAAWRADVTSPPPGGESLARPRRAGRARPATTWSRRPATATSWSSPTSRRSRRRWRGPWASATRCRWRMFVAPASITRIAVGERGPSLHGFNDVAHLAGSRPGLSRRYGRRRAPTDPRSSVPARSSCSAASAACGDDDRCRAVDQAADPVPTTRRRRAAPHHGHHHPPHHHDHRAAIRWPTPRPDWLGTRVLHVGPNGYAAAQPTPPELVDRRLETPDHLPRPPTARLPGRGRPRCPTTCSPAPPGGPSARPPARSCAGCS